MYSKWSWLRSEKSKHGLTIAADHYPFHIDFTSPNLQIHVLESEGVLEVVYMQESTAGERGPPVKHFLLDLDMFETFVNWCFWSADAMLIRRASALLPFASARTVRQLPVRLLLR